MILDVLIISREDFKKRNFFDWLLSHISGALPPHRFSGKIEISSNGIFFDGYDNYLKIETHFTIQKNQIVQVYHGYDSIFNIFQTRGLGIAWAPIRLQLEPIEKENFLYIIAGYTYMGTQNKEFYPFLIDWLS